CVRVQSNFDVW
nr:immunoglobulin heavy chain junction region [Macaca mulatta]